MSHSSTELSASARATGGQTSAAEMAGMRLLVVSDIHANWDALDAVLQATAGEYDAILCLGDIVGYGANPVECSLWARDRCREIIRGNHDVAVVEPERLRDFNWQARQAVEWTRAQLHPDQLRWLAELPHGPREIAGMRLAHGSPRDEDEYVIAIEQAFLCLADLPAQAEPSSAEAGREASEPAPPPGPVPPVTCIGHTHIQGGFSLRQNHIAVLRPELPPSPQARMQLQLDPETRYLLNPGSVGQPRDGDWRAAYLLCATGGNTVTFGRTEYDLQAAQRKILSAGLPRHLADRLAIGK